VFFCCPTPVRKKASVKAKAFVGLFDVSNCVVEQRLLYGRRAPAALELAHDLWVDKVAYR
jgi:hypothetical protein